MFNNDIWLLLQSAIFFVGSVSDMGAFPPTLTLEEENEHLEELANGSVSARRELG